jgi:carbonic anhydrase
VHDGAPREAYLGRLERASAVATLDNLLTFPWIRTRVAAGQLALIAAYFDVATGHLAVFDPASGAFAPASEAVSAPSAVA